MASIDEKKLAAVIKLYADDSEKRADSQDRKIEALRTELGAAKERLAKLEGQHEYVREDVTGMHSLHKRNKSSPPKSAGGKDALDTLKTIGPWILGALGIIGALVNYILSHVQ